MIRDGRRPSFCSSSASPRSRSPRGARAENPCEQRDPDGRAREGRTSPGRSCGCAAPSTAPTASRRRRESSCMPTRPTRRATTRGSPLGPRASGAGCGRTRSGRFELLTIRPGNYPNRSTEAHIHTELWGGGRAAAVGPGPQLRRRRAAARRPQAGVRGARQVRVREKPGARRRRRLETDWSIRLKEKGDWFESNIRHGIEPCGVDVASAALRDLRPSAAPASGSRWVRSTARLIPRSLRLPRREASSAALAEIPRAAYDATSAALQVFLARQQRARCVSRRCRVYSDFRYSTRSFFSGSVRLSF